jgi:hypothetical protein
MSNNLATIFVGLGYDLSALEKGAPEAFRLINQTTAGMSAEMKRASREGAESFRLIDEALGIHVSRPLTRLLTQEFPGFAKGLQSLLGAGVVGALGVAGFEFFDKIAKSIDQAEKAEQEFAAATQKTNEVFADAMASYEKADKLRSLSGLNLELFKIDSSSIEEERKRIDGLADALEKEAKAAVDAKSPWTEFLAGLSEEMHGLGSLNSTLGAESINAKLGEFQKKYDDLSRTDALKGTHQAADSVNTALSQAKTTLSTMQGMKLNGLDQTINEIGKWVKPGIDRGAGYSQKEIDAQAAYIEGLEKIQRLQSAADSDQAKKDAAARAADAMERQKEAIRELQGDLKSYNDEANKTWENWMKINAELEKAAGVDFSTKTSTGAGTLGGRAGALPLLTQAAPPPGAPGLADAEELQKVTDDQNESWKKAGEIVAGLETPLEKYNAQLAILKELEDQGRVSTAQFAQAQQNLQEELAKSEQAVEKLLKSGGAAGGLQAFLMQLAGQGTKGADGQAVFDMLNRGLQGFEDETAKALTGAKTNWSSFFESLNQMGLKFVMNKVTAQLFQGFEKSGLAKSLGLDKVLSHGAGQASTVAAENANTTATAANTQAILALTQSMFASRASGSGGFSPFGSLGIGAGGGDAAEALGSSGDGAVSAGAAGGMWSFASGTDYAPGGMSLVGEEGPELVNLPTGASVTPNSMLRSGGITFHNHIDARGGEIGVEEKISRALTAAAPQIIMRAVVASSEVAKRTPR